MRRIGLKLSVVMCLSTGLPAAAQQSISDIGEVREGLIAVGIAYEISEVCSAIDARVLRGVTYLNQLRGIARDRGFSRDEVEAYIDDRAERDRLEGVVRRRLAAMGAVPGDAASHCAVGRQEIAQGTVIGHFLRQ